MTTPYWSRIFDNAAELHRCLDRVIDRHGAKPVGSGYIDVIVRSLDYREFLDSLTELGIATHMVTLWCEATPENKRRHGCPHGMGGPIHDGVWYSEMCEPDPFDVKDHGVLIATSELDPFTLSATRNALASGYMAEGIRGRPDYSPCLAPGFWLAVPKEWRSSVKTDLA